MIVVAVVAGPDTSVGDAVALAAWSVLAVAATVVLVRRPAARCGTWLVVGLACVVVVVDKALDVQYLGYRSLRLVARVVESAAGLPEHDPSVRTGLLLAATLGTVAALAAIWWRDRRRSDGCRLAVFGIGLVLTWVGMRFVPWLPWLTDPRIGWAVEVVAGACIAAGLARAGRHRVQSAGSRTKSPVSDGST